MPHYGLLGNYISDDPAKDIRGRTLYGTNDEKLGKIADVIFDHSTGDIAYIVVDTGGWLRSNKFILPPEHLPASSAHPDDFVSDLTKEQIEKFPPYDEKRLASPDEWSDYENTYRQGWDSLIMDRQRVNRPLGRWDDFQSLLRQRRAEIVGECGSCADEESGEDLRRAG
jgi:PRC-barrel domain